MSATLFHVPRYWPAIGGAELHSRQLAHELTHFGEVAVLTHYNGEQACLASGAAKSDRSESQDGDITIYQTGVNGVVRNALSGLAKRYAEHRSVRPAFSRLFKTAIQSQVESVIKNYDLVHSVYNGLTEGVELVASAARSMGKPFVWTPLVNTDIKQNNAWSSRRFRRLYQKVDALIALTNYERQWLISKGVSPQRVHVCPVGPLVCTPPDSMDFRNRYGLGDSPIILFLGRVTQCKGVGVLLDAARGIWSRFPRAHIVIAGPQDEATRGLLNGENDPRVLRIEKLTQEEKCSAIQACDLLCVPSRSESLGAVYLEAWHFSKPVVALDIPVLREVIGQGVGGILTGHSGIDVANAVCQLLQDPCLLTKMGEAGKAKLFRYEWKRIAKQIRAVHTLVLDAKANTYPSKVASF